MQRGTGKDAESALAHREMPMLRGEFIHPRVEQHAEGAEQHDRRHGNRRLTVVGAHHRRHGDSCRGATHRAAGAYQNRLAAAQAEKRRTHPGTKQQRCHQHQQRDDDPTHAKRRDCTKRQAKAI